MSTLTIEQLSALLRATSEAHGVYEQKLGHYDEQWPEWYSKHLSAALTKQLGDKVPPALSPEKLPQVFREAEAAHKGRTEPWPEFYAKFFLSVRNETSSAVRKFSIT